ncbi:cold shock protein [Vairimorpha necatrix]|uniref:Cold shock protein n=1 Tax=Vairimorpha necatrix TaxID=6039 RepID=A0AAX4JDW8_9MICR
MKRTNDIDNLYNGKIKFFNNKKGYGFIICDQIEQDIFFHFTSINNLHNELYIMTDMILTFHLMKGAKGFYAKNIDFVESDKNKQATYYKKFILFLGGVINDEIKNKKN